MKLRKILAVLVLLSPLLVCVVAGLVLLNVFTYSRSWTLDEVNKILPVGIPKNASNIQIDGVQERSFSSLDVTFVASPQDAFDFAEQFCGGLLHVAYDPFNATDSMNSFPNSLRMSVGSDNQGVSYYSFSQNTPVSTRGNRCMWSGAPIEIRLTQIGQYSLQVRFHIFPACGDACSVETVLQNYAHTN